MRIGAVVQARMSSRRLPGKVLAPMGGRPVLLWALERLARCPSLAEVAVATSCEPGDDAVAAFCRDVRAPCVRGSLENVARRMARAADVMGLDAFVRIGGDSPLIDPGLVERAVEIFEAERPDLVTNVHPRSFPPGQSVEVVERTTFSAAVRIMTEPAHREHVTLHYYQAAAAYRIHNVSSTRDYGDLRLVVDTPGDLDAMDALVAQFERPQWTYGIDDLADLAQSPGTTAPRPPWRIDATPLAAPAAAPPTLVKPRNQT